VKTIVRRCAALDVHKDSIAATVRTPRRGGGREQQQATFGASTTALLGLRDWLPAHKVTQVAMEATGIYWRPVWAVLEDEFELLLVNARHVKQVPGRKTDLSDSAWLLPPARGGAPARELRAAAGDPASNSASARSMAARSSSLNGVKSGPYSMPATTPRPARQCASCSRASLASSS
jgi:hypothetical protein